MGNFYCGSATIRERLGVKIYSKKLTAAQNAAFEQFEGITSFAPFAVAEFERGEITANELWQKNVSWIVGVAGSAERIQFPQE